MFSVTIARMSFSKKWLPISSHPLALCGQVIGRDHLDRDWTRRLDPHSTALLRDQPHRESRVGAQIVAQHHRDAAFAQQSPVVGIEVVGNKRLGTPALMPSNPTTVAVLPPPTESSLTSTIARPEARSAVWKPISRSPSPRNTVRDSVINTPDDAGPNHWFISMRRSPCSLVVDADVSAA